MSWSTLPDNVKQLAERELTPPQLRCFVLELAGMSTRRIADSLDIADSTARDHLRAAHRKLKRHGVRQHPNGTYHLEEAA